MTDLHANTRDDLHQFLLDQLQEIAAFVLDGEKITDPEFLEIAEETDQLEDGRYRPGVDTV